MKLYVDVKGQTQRVVFTGYKVVGVSYFCWGCRRRVMVNAMNCGIVVREFVLQSRYYVHWYEHPYPPTPMARETWVQSQVESYQRLKKWYFISSLCHYLGRTSSLLCLLIRDAHKKINLTPGGLFTWQHMLSRLKRVGLLPDDWDTTGEGPCGVMVKAMVCGIVVSEFVLQSRYYVHFRANILGKGTNPLILPAMG